MIQALTFAGSMLLAVFVFAQPCDCLPPKTMQDALGAVDYAFSGQVTSVETNWISGGWKYTFRVDSSWKQGLDRAIVINTGWAEDCGYIFEKGRQYLVFVKRVFTPKTHYCAGNQPWENNPEMAAALGPALAPRRSPLFGPMSFALAGLGIFSFLFLAFVLFGRKWLQSRSRT